MRDFRRELRRRAHEYKSQEYERLENIFEVDNGAFQRIIFCKRKSKGIQTNALKIDGDPKESCEIWKQDYSKLYTPADSTSFDQNFTTMLKTVYMNMRERVEMPNGCELWNNLTTREIVSFERCQRFNAKRLQGLPRNTIDQKLLLDIVYFARLCNMNSLLISKQIFVGRLFSHLSDPSKQRLGLIPDIIGTLEKYNLISYT